MVATTVVMAVVVMAAVAACAKLLVKYTPKTDKQPKKIHGVECQTSNIQTKLNVNKTNLRNALSVCCALRLLTYCSSLGLQAMTWEYSSVYVHQCSVLTYRNEKREKVPAKKERKKKRIEKFSDMNGDSSTRCAEPYSCASAISHIIKHIKPVASTDTRHAIH